MMDDGEYLYLAVQFACGAADPGCFLSISKTFQISLPAREYRNLTPRRVKWRQGIKLLAPKIPGE